MPHVGNDIVDLNTRGTIGKALDKRFVDRILNNDEKKILYRQKENQDTLLWAFWAAKEAAFKAVSKSCPNISSAPRRYPVTLDQVYLKPELSGSVKTPEGTVAVSIFIRDHHVHCIGTTGNLNDLANIFHDIKKIDFKQKTKITPDQQSLMVRKLAKDKIASHLNIDAGNFDIQRNRQDKCLSPPVIRFKNHKPDMEISLSHHGLYVAFAALDKKKE